MAQFDSSIIFRQEPYTGPTIEDVQNKQNLNALRNTLGEGYRIDDPKVVNAMMARDPDMGLKLMTNANAMRKSASDVETADQTRMAAELDRYVPVAMAVAQNKDQAAWSELHGELTRMFPVLGKSLPTDVTQALPAVQSYVAARQELASKANTAPFRYGAPVATDQGFMVLGENGQPTLLKDASGRPFMPPPKGADGGGGPETFSTTNPQTITLADGTVVPYVLGSYGTSRAVPLPPGAKWNPPTTTVSTPTTVEVVQKGTGNIVSSTPKDVAGAASLTAQGKALGEMLAASGNAVQTGEHISKQIDALLKDPQREAGTGWSAFFNVIPTSEGKSYQLKVDQLGGQAFLQAFNSLKGGGAITEQEGNKATTAIARLNTTLSEKDFIQALTDFKDAVDSITERRRKENQGAIPGLRVGQQPAAGAATPAPAGAVNPADPLGLLGGK